MGALAQAVDLRQGAVRGPVELRRADSWSGRPTILADLHVPFIINQNKYNILDRTVERERAEGDGLASLGKGLITFCPLAQGLLTDRYLNGIPDGFSRVAHDPRFLQRFRSDRDARPRARSWP